MPRNGSGTYTRTNGYNTGATLWATDRDTGTKIVAVRHDTHDQDLAAALTASIANDGQTPITADLPMSGYKHTNVADALARTQYATAKQVQDGAITWAGTTGGTTSAYTATLAPAITSYTDGLTVRVKFNATCAGSATINLNGVGAKAILVGDQRLNVRAGEIQINQIVTLVYCSDGGGYFQLISQAITGTANQITVTYGANGATLSLASSGVALPGLSASQIMMSDSSSQATTVDYLSLTSTHLDPKTDNSFILGSSSKLYQTLYTYGIIGGNATFKLATPTGYGQYLLTNGDLVNPKVVVYPTGGVDINANSSTSAVLKLQPTGIIDFRGTMGNSSKDPATQSPADWIEVQIAGNTYYIPVYAA